MNLPFNRFTKLIMLTAATAVSMVSCSPPEEIQEAEALSLDYRNKASELNTDFFRTTRISLENDPGVDLSPYTQLRDKVVNDKTQFMTKLAKCETQAEADALFKEQVDYTTENDLQKATMHEVVNNNKVLVELRKFKTKANNAESIKKSTLDIVQAFQDEEGEDECVEEIDRINTNLDEGNAKLRSINSSSTGFNSKLDAKRSEIDDLHAEITRLMEERATAYRNWAPRPPDPERPEKVLFTIKTTPAMYEQLLAPLAQQYKNYTLMYTGPKTGNRCIADAQNKEGIVFRIVKPADLGLSLDKLEQNMADAVISFRNAFPEEHYAQFEERAAANDQDLNSIIVSGMAYSALVIKTGNENQLVQATTAALERELGSCELYIGEEGTLDKELFDIILPGSTLPAKPVVSPIKSGTAAANGAALVAFRREATGGKDLRIARTVSDDSVYFFPTVGNIATGRYAYGASVNAVLNPSSSGYDNIREFLDFVLSAQGQNVVKSTGFISRDEYDEDNVELKRLKKLFLKQGYTIGRIITHDTFLFPKNDTRISKNPVVSDRKADFREFDSNIRSNFGHITNVLNSITSNAGIIAVGIIGHASSEGGAAINLPLSMNRAKYTGAHIKDRTKVQLLLTDGMSSEVPVDTNKEESGRIRNRRATAYVLEVFEIGTSGK